MTKWKTGEIQDSTYGSKSADASNGRWGMKAMAARIKEIGEVDDVLVIGIDFGTTLVTLNNLPCQPELTGM
jgi:hypothetical protein